MAELAKVFCYTKNEYDMIEHFIIYYGELFGYHNVVIIDNTSTDPQVLQVYQKYQPKGIIVHFTPTSHHHQGAECSRIMKLYKDQCQFLILVDTDEFITLEPLEPINKEKLMTFYRNLPSDMEIFHYRRAYHSTVVENQEGYEDHHVKDPILHMTHFTPPGEAIKNFFRASTFTGTNNGNHSGSSLHNRTMYLNNYITIHYQYTGIKRRIEKDRMHLLGYGYIQETDDVKAQLHKLRNGFIPCGGHRLWTYLDHLARGEQYRESFTPVSNTIHIPHISTFIQNALKAN